MAATPGQQQQQQQQQQRDVKRVLQVLLPGFAQPQIEMACNAFFASTSMHKPPQHPRSSQFRLRRVDSGQLGNFHFSSSNWGTGPCDKQFCQELKPQQFDWAMDVVPSPSEKKR